jgi:tripartite-type tricarboxylate transporter receptor subunit TctC
MMKTISRRAMLGALGATAMTGSVGARAQSAWRPTQPVRIIVPFSPGGGTDVIARVLAQGLGAELGQSVVVENKAGASGAIGSDYAFAASPDGHVLLLGTADAQAMNPHVNKVRFETPKYTVIGGIAKAPFVLVGRPGLPAANLSELLQLTRQSSLTYSSSGPGAAPHIQMSMFADATKVSNLHHIPYQGAAPAFQALVAEQVDLTMVPIVLSLQYRDKLRFFGVLSAERSEALRDVPTLIEQGYAVDADSWAGMLAPPGVPEPIVSSLSDKLRTVVASADVQKRLRDLGMTPYLGTRGEFTTFFRAEYERWGKAIRALNLSTTAAK